MDTKNKTYLVTGANRGIGKGMVSKLLLRPSTTVIATVRDPIHTTSQSLLSLPRDPDSNIHILQLDSSHAETGFASLAADLHSAGVAHLDVVVSNAGASSGYSPAHETPAAAVLADYTINAVAFNELFKATWPLLQKSTIEEERKLVLITSSMGSIAWLEKEPLPGISYGMSKAAANWLAKKISIDYKSQGLKVGIIHPGWVQTPMGQGLADALSYPSPPMTVEDSSRICVDLIDKLCPERSGKYYSDDGSELPW